MLSLELAPQDEAWREQQKRLLTAQFGPREVESLAMNAVLPLAAQEMQPDAPLFFVQERELHELQVRCAHCCTHYLCFAYDYIIWS